MFSLRAAFSVPVYIQLSPARVSVRNVNSGAVFAEIPEIAIQTHAGGHTVLACGAAARLPAAAPGLVVTNPFGHPRSLVSDFHAAELVLRYFLFQVCPSKMFSPSPTIVMHPLGEPVGGYTQIELRALRELAVAIGAAKVFLWQGQPLDDAALRDMMLIRNAGRAPT